MSRLARGMIMHISKRDAEAEAVRIAEAFLATEWPEPIRFQYKLGWVSPNLAEAGSRDRKTIIKYTVVFLLDLPDGCKMDGGEAMIRVDIKKREARWLLP